MDMATALIDGNFGNTSGFVGNANGVDYSLRLALITEDTTNPVDMAYAATPVPALSPIGGALLLGAIAGLSWRPAAAP